jgi:hypothetical protein
MRVGRGSRVYGCDIFGFGRERQLVTGNTTMNPTPDPTHPLDSHAVISLPFAGRSTRLMHRILKWVDSYSYLGRCLPHCSNMW